MNSSPRTERRQSGQAAVETALTMPLLVFLILGTTQLFMLLQARILAQHAAYRAVRAGSLNQGDCLPMMHSAIVTVLPSITDTSSPTLLAKAFGDRQNNQTKVQGFNGPIIELVRESPTAGQIGGAEDLNFDDPSAGRSLTLELRMVYWYYMKIPFANRVMSWIFLAHFGIQDFRGQNPLMYTERKTRWSRGASVPLSRASWPGGTLSGRLRTWSRQGHYLFPIEVNSAMRMMTPAKRSYFRRQACPLSPPF